MTATVDGLDAHARPPSTLRVLFKKWQKYSSICDLEDDQDVLDTARLDQSLAVRSLPVSHASLAAFEEGLKVFSPEWFETREPVNYSCFEVLSLPGLFIYPSLLPHHIQTELLNKLLHRDLGHPAHKTNLHLHYDVTDFVTANSPISNESSRPSFFAMNPEAALAPKDSTIHKPLKLQQVLEKKLRWLTLGGQYDWTAKVYPDELPPQFPEDVANLLRALFSSVDPQAAILNFYSPGDMLSLHRDVSEDCDRDLISVSIGCEALFLVANTDGTSHATIRLRSGDAVVMSGPSRYAWHAVPKVFANTCPLELRDWPAGETNDGSWTRWKGWLANKRINLNVRQMKAES